MDAPTRSLRPEPRDSEPSPRPSLEAMPRWARRSEPFPPRSISTRSAYAAEQHALFHKLPLLLAPSALVPSPNLAVAHDGYGTPLILSRARPGRGACPANVCRHRGTRLLEVSDEAMPASRIVCPYHAWTYRSGWRPHRPCRGPIAFPDRQGRS